MSTLSTRARVGFWLAVVLALVDVAGLLAPSAPDGAGPPVEVVVFSAVMGAVTLVAAGWLARSAARAALRVMAGSRVLAGITALPAFFVPGVPGAFVLWGAATVVLTVVAVVLLMTRARTPTHGGTPAP